MKAVTNGFAFRPIRVVHVASQLDVGGMEKLLVEYARLADPERFQLHFVSLGARGGLADDIEAYGWPVTALERPVGVRAGLVLRLAGLFRDTETDVVHTHNSRPLIYSGPAACLAGVPAVIHTRHGRRLGSGRRSISLFRSATRLASRVVCVSRDCAHLSRRERVAPNKLSVIHNGIDVARFAYTGPCPEGPVVTVGRLSPEKDVETLLRAAALAAGHHPSFRVEVAGDGASMPALQRTARELRLGERVRFLGEVRDVPGLLARAALFVLPSLTEGISLTLLEAMARGLPVVATRVGGNSEVIVDGETGYLVPSGSPALLAERILLLLRDERLARRLGENGRRRVEKCFDIRQMVRRYEALYGQVLGGRDREPGAKKSPLATSATHG